MSAPLAAVDIRQNAEQVLRNSMPLVDWSREPFVPWKGMRFFHGTEYALLQSSGAPVDMLREPPDVLRSWEVFTSMMNTRAGVHIRHRQPDCQLRPETSFTSPYFEKALKYSKGLHVFTYRLKKDGRELRMIDLRTDYDTPSRRTTRDRFYKLSQLTGLVYGNDSVNGTDRNELAATLCAIFRGKGVYGAILNNDIEWIWFEPDKMLEWEWNPDFGSLVNRLASIGFLGQPSLPQHIADFLMRNVDPSLHHVKLPDLIRHWNWLDTIFREKAASPETFTVRINRFLSGKRVSHTKVTYREWAIRSSKPGIEYTNQYLVESKHNAPSTSEDWPVAEVETNPSIIRVVEVDYVQFWQFVYPDAIDMYMGNAVTEGIGAKDALTPYRTLLSVLAGQIKESPNKKLIQLLFRLPNGCAQLVPPISDATKKHIADAAERTKAAYEQRLSTLRSKRKMDDNEDESRPAARARTNGPSGTAGMLVLV